jgi:hypothetical protein
MKPHGVLTATLEEFLDNSGESGHEPRSAVRTAMGHGHSQPVTPEAGFAYNTGMLGCY